MSILILGAAGNLGGQLKKFFSNQELYSWDKFDFNFLDFQELSERLRALSPRVIINAAAYNAVDKCETDEAEAVLAWKLNRDLPGVLADYCLEANSWLVHYSTDYVFGGDGRLAGAYQENEKPNPINVYGRTKFAGEQEIARRALLGLNYYLIRTSKLFGPKGDNPDSKPSFFDIMLSLSEKQAIIKVVDAEKSCFTYTPDLAVATKALIDENAGKGIYHLCNSGEATWYEAAQYFFQAIKRHQSLEALKPEDWPRPAARPPFSALVNKRRLPLRSWQKALDEYLQFLDIK